VEVGQRVVPRRARYDTHHICKASELTLIPDGITQKQAVLALMTHETYYVCHYMVRIQPEDSVLIIGVGPFGLLCLEHVREIGCTAIVAADVMAGRLHAARDLGATHVVNAAQDDVVAAVPHLLGCAPRVVIETSAQAGPLRQAFKVVAPGGKVVIAGRPHTSLSDFEIEDIFDRMITVYGAKTPPAGYGRRYTAIALDLIRQGKIHADQLISHEFPLSRIAEAFELATHPERGGLKVVVNCAAVR